MAEMDGERASQYSALQSGEQSRLAKYKEGLRPVPENAQFAQEIENPRFRLDSNTGINYAVYRINADKEGVPVIVNLPWSSGAETRLGRPLLNVLSQKIDRPIIVCDAVGTGKTSIPSRQFVKEMDFDKLAQSAKTALDVELSEMGAEEIDIVGASMGGIMAAKLAELYGDRARDLITLSTPGIQKKKKLAFAKGFLVDEAQATEAIVREDEYGQSEDTIRYEEIYGKPGVSLNTANLPLKWKVALTALKPVFDQFGKYMAPEVISAERIPTFLKLGILMTKDPLANLPRQLSEDTYWTDVVGSNEAITDMDEHLSLVRERRTELTKLGLPSRSNIHILGKQPHSWTQITTWLGDNIATLLETSQTRKIGDSKAQSHNKHVITGGRISKPPAERG